MKEIFICLFLSGIIAQPILEPAVNKVYKKLDAQTLEVTTTMTTVNKVILDKAELQTELDHIPDHIAEYQKQIDALNERALEIQSMLDKLK